MYPELSADAIVYRIIRRQNWIEYDTREVMEDAYKLRYFPRDKAYEKNISVRIAEFCTVEKCIQDFQPCYGIAAIKVGIIRTKGLDVIRDKEEHGSIINVPNEKENRKKSQEIALFLADNSELIWLPEI
ncbi:MAG TPA: hypothetical protein VK184_22175 [Nostocaceae cyanobacterium]|nr:hypothetical protein [Nostocaceae cyanobacterium]